MESESMEKVIESPVVAAEKPTIALLDETVQVPKELNDVRVAIVKIVESSKKACEDGFQAGQDIPAVVMASYQSLVLAIDGISKVKYEAKHAMGESIVCASLMGTDILKALK